MAHRHAHGAPHDDEGFGEVPVHRVLLVVVGGIALLTVAGLVAYWPRGDALVSPAALGFSERVNATVVGAEVADCSFDPDSRCDVVTAEVRSGADAGERAILEFPLDVSTPAATLRVDDRIVLNDAGAGVPTEVRYSFADFQRGGPLWLLVALFAAAVVALGRFRGLLALGGLVVSIGVLVAFVLPALLRGSPPVPVAVTGTMVIAMGALYLAHGFSHRTTVALLGTVASLVITAILAQLFAAATELTGLATEESLNLLAFAPELDFRGLLLAAVIIGALGVLDDVTVTQVSAVWELHRTNERLSRSSLYRAGIRIGRDHIASTVNTLVLAYAAASLPLLLIFTQSGLPAGQIVTTETVAIQVVQTLVGSIGLVSSVPITTALAAWVATRG